MAATEINVDFSPDEPVEPVFDGELDDLLGLDEQTLDELYEQARVPMIASLDGDLRGRMLATGILPPSVDAIMERWAGSNVFPWGGKSFRPLAPTVGRGINRLAGGALKMYPFLTEIGPSRAGDFDALQLDYDLPENPFFIRAIKDEVRELAPSLWLGRAYMELGGNSHFVLFFGLTDR